MISGFFDPKPFGAFIEYTLKPILDDCRELIEILDAHGLKASELHLAWKIFLFQAVLDFLKSIMVTGMICFTVYFILSNSHAIKG